VTTAGTPPNSALIPGTYSSVQPWSNLTGCALNGTWTLTIVDNWAIDNGFICGWGLNFNPALFPSLTQFTPALGTSTLDSASWTGNGVVTNPNNPLSATATPVGVGTHEYTFSVTDNFGCTYDTTITVIVNPGIQGPIIITGDPVVCDGGIAYIHAPAGYDTYNWNNGAFGPNISGGPGTYIVTVALGDCSLPSEPFVVTQAANPTPVITGPDYSCAGQPVVLSTTQPYATYQWSNGAQGATNAVGTGSYTVTVTTPEGCSGTSAPFDVLVGNTPTAGINADPASPQNPGTTVQFSDASNGNGSQIVDWQWSFGDGGAGSSQPGGSHTYNTPGTYEVTLVVTTAEGCVDTATIAYVIRPADVIIPNVFSPNGDGVNDALVFENVQYYNNTLTVFNRWGQEVFTANNYKNNWRAIDVPDGTYYFVLVLNEDGREFTGHVTILR
jgi:gliding motility-associated-like protein